MTRVFLPDTLTQRFWTAPGKESERALIPRFSLQVTVRGVLKDLFGIYYPRPDRRRARARGIQSQVGTCHRDYDARRRGP